MWGVRVGPQIPAFPMSYLVLPAMGRDWAAGRTAGAWGCQGRRLADAVARGVVRGQVWETEHSPPPWRHRMDLSYREECALVRVRRKQPRLCRQPHGGAGGCSSTEHAQALL